MVLQREGRFLQPAAPAVLLPEGGHRPPHRLLTHLKLLGMVQATSPVNGNVTDLQDKRPAHGPSPAHPQSGGQGGGLRLGGPRGSGEQDSGLRSPCCSAALLLAEMRLCNGSRTQRAPETLGYGKKRALEPVNPCPLRFHTPLCTLRPSEPPPSMTLSPRPRNLRHLPLYSTNI